TRSLVHIHVFLCSTRRPPIPTLFPYTTLFRSDALDGYISRYQVQRQLVLWVPLLLLLATAWHSLLAAALLLVTAPLVPLFMVLRSEEHTSELQSRENLVCRLLLEKKKTNSNSC